MYQQSHYGWRKGESIDEDVQVSDHPSRTRWRVNGKVKTWERDHDRIRVPLKHDMEYSMNDYDYLDECNLKGCGFESENEEALS